MSQSHQLQSLDQDSRADITDDANNFDDVDSVDSPYTSSQQAYNDQMATSPVQAHLVRCLALLCACSLSVGSHYASYILGPLKSRLSRELGTSDVEFSLLISALSLNGTWTPLLGGVMASKLGTTLTSVIATGVIFGGQALVLIGDTQGSVRMMVFGLFVFGLGTSPLSVVQESIIIRFFSSHGLGVSMALGLVAGKGASFVSASTSYPLAAKFGRHAPFIASTTLTGVSFVVNLVYLSVSKWLVRASGVSPEASEARSEARRLAIHDVSEAEALEKVAKKRHVDLSDVLALGDIFWTYIGLNVLCGMLWHPFIHLSANILERRYHLGEAVAGDQASYLLVGSIILYPACGYLVDRLKHPQAILRLLMLAAMFTMICYAWLSVPPQWTQTPLPGVLSFATGIGFSPLLLVVIVPNLVPLKYVSTTLGMHKSLEHTGTTMMQMLAGIWLEKGDPASGQNYDAAVTQYLLLTFLLLNVLQLLVLVILAYLYQCRRRTSEDLPYVGVLSEVPTPVSDGYLPVHQSESETAPMTVPSPTVEGQPLLTGSAVLHSNEPLSSDGPDHAVRLPEIRRGRIFAYIYTLLVCSCWLLFLGTAWSELRSKEERQGVQMLRL